MAPLLIPAEWVEDKLNLYKKLKADIVTQIKKLDPSKNKDINQANILYTQLLRNKDCIDLLKEMKEASITKP